MATPAGNPDANCVLDAWRRHERELLGFLRGRAAGRDEAEDVLQEVFARALLQGRTFCSLDNPRAWLFQVARNALADRARLAKPTVELPESLAQPTEERPAVEALADCLPRTLSELPEDDREVITKCDVEGLRQRDFAALKGITLAAAKSRLLRARRRLRDHLVRHCRVSFDEAGRVCCHIPRGPV